jgi:1,2-diacylglycerol 3-beta-glucosyltransferase
MILSLENILPLSVLVIALWYALNGILLYKGLNRTYSRVSHRPRISVLIAARDEERNLPHCLRSLSRIEYPKELCEVLVLNDHSTDKTLDIARQFAQENNHIHVLNIDEKKYGLQGKMNVLAQGIEKASGEIILITDADCIVPESWIKEFVSYFTPRTGMVGGLTLLTGPGLFHKLQSFDWLFLQTIASGTTGIGKPVTILGNNFAFRKEAYEEVGGFRQIGFSLTEDMALMQAIKNHTNYDIVYPLEIGHMIWSEAEQNLQAVYHQRLRWMSGGKKASVWGYSLMVCAFLSKLIILISIIWGIFTSLTLAGLILLLLTEFILPWKVLHRVDQSGLIKLWPFFEIYYFVYTLILGLLFWIPKKVNWKKRVYISEV